MTAYTEKIQHDLANLLRARFTYIYIPTWEEERAIQTINDTVKDEKMIKTVRNIYYWSQASGFIDENGKKQSGTTEPDKAIDYICN